MTGKNENRLNMYLVVVDYLNTVPAGTLDSMPGFSQLFAEFNNNVQSIQTKSESQSASRVGYQMEKTAGKEAVVNYAITMNDCIAAYATATNNTVLKKEMSFTKTVLLRNRDTGTLDDAKFILSKGVELLSVLDPYGIKQEQIDVLTNLISTFSDNIPLPRKVINRNKLTNVEINELFIQTNEVLKHMDVLSKILRQSNTVYFTEYFYSRKIVNNRGRKLSVRGVVTDATGIPIAGVLISIPVLKKETKTTAKGYYEFKHLPKGMHNLIFSRVDFQTTNRQVGIVSGQRVQLDVTMQAAQNAQDVA